MGKSKLAQAKIMLFKHIQWMQIPRVKQYGDPHFQSFQKTEEELTSKVQHQQDFMHGISYTEVEPISLHRYLAFAERERAVTFCPAAAAR